jgi:hypothetical protein
VVVACALSGAACATRTINQVIADPARYQNRTVRVNGSVVDSYSVMNRGAYRIDDGTGQLWIISDRGVPGRTARVSVKGTVRSGFTLGNLGDLLKLPPSIANGIVMIESSHRARN